MLLNSAVHRIDQRLRFVLLLLMTWLLCSCSSIKLVADYDAEAAKAITDTSASVFALYDRMLAARVGADKRVKLPYAPYADDWGRIETQIRVMVVREESRPLNSDSESIAKTILTFWHKYREEHAKSDNYNAAQLRIHRDRFQRLFAAALRAEKAKQLAVADTSPGAAQAKDQADQLVEDQ